MKNIEKKIIKFINWGLGIGDWGLGIGRLIEMFMI